MSVFSRQGQMLQHPRDSEKSAGFFFFLFGGTQPAPSQKGHPEGHNIGGAGTVIEVTSLTEAVWSQ